MKISRFLSDGGWKDLASKNKVKDNGLQKALEKLKKLDEDAFDDAGKALAEVSKLALALKKDKAVASLDEVTKYLGEVIDAAETAQRDVDKRRAEHDKEQKAKAAAEKKAADKAAAAKKAEEDDEEEDEEDSPAEELLTTKFKPLFKMVLQGDRLFTLVAKSGKKVAVLLARKPIPPTRRRMLAEHLGGGSTKYYPGTCSLEAGFVTFTLSAEVTGLSKLMKLALLEQSGRRINKVKCRGDDGDDNDEDDN